MPETVDILNRSIPQFFALSAIEGGAFVAITTIYNHRQLTHQSLELTPIAEHAAGQLCGFQA